LPLTAVGSNPARDILFFHVRKLKTVVVPLQRLLVPKIMHEGASD
jgi:hypothetical protein